MRRERRKRGGKNSPIIKTKQSVWVRNSWVGQQQGRFTLEGGPQMFNLFREYLCMSVHFLLIEFVSFDAFRYFNNCAISNFLFKN